MDGWIDDGRWMVGKWTGLTCIACYSRSQAACASRQVFALVREAGRESYRAEDETEDTEGA